MGAVDSYQVGSVREGERDGDYRIPSTAPEFKFLSPVHTGILLGQFSGIVVYFVF